MGLGFLNAHAAQSLHIWLGLVAKGLGIRLEFLGPHVGVLS